MYVSCRKPLPEPEVLEYEVAISLEDLAIIPDNFLKESFVAALAESNGFVPGNGLILKMYRGEEEDQHEAAAKAIRNRDAAYYLNYKPEGVTPEQRSATADLMRGIREQLGPGSRGKLGKMGIKWKSMPVYQPRENQMPVADPVEW